MRGTLPWWARVPPRIRARAHILTEISPARSGIAPNSLVRFACSPTQAHSTQKRMATLSRPSSRASVRSEAPVPPPKPPHLTLSLRRAEAKPRPRMPRWSRGASVIGDGEGGAVVESGGKKEDEDEGKGGSTLHARPKGREVSASLDLGGGTLSERGGSTLRPAGAPKTQGTRLSILFCTSVDNPLAGGGTVNTHQKVSSSTPSASPSLTPSSSVNATDGGGEDERGEGGTEEAEVTVLDITGPAVRAVSTHAFEGEAAFGELSFGKGVELEIEVADLGGNWSLGWVVEEGQAGRGLIPIGYYKVSAPDCYPGLSPILIYHFLLGHHRGHGHRSTTFRGRPRAEPSCNPKDATLPA